MFSFQEFLEFLMLYGVQLFAFLILLWVFRRWYLRILFWIIFQVTWVYSVAVITKPVDWGGLMIIITSFYLGFIGIILYLLTFLVTSYKEAISYKGMLIKRTLIILSVVILCVLVVSPLLLGLIEDFRHTQDRKKADRGQEILMKFSTGTDLLGAINQCTHDMDKQCKQCYQYESNQMVCSDRLSYSILGIQNTLEKCIDVYTQSRDLVGYVRYKQVIDNEFLRCLQRSDMNTQGNISNEQKIQICDRFPDLKDECYFKLHFPGFSSSQDCDRLSSKSKEYYYFCRGYFSEDPNSPIFAEQFCKQGSYCLVGYHIRNKTEDNCQPKYQCSRIILEWKNEN